MSDCPKTESPQPGSFETGRSKGNSTSKKKARRVSQRRELAVVTLGAVAAITGLGGFLAANPPDWATASETATPQTAAAFVEPETVGGEPDGPPGDESAVHALAYLTFVLGLVHGLLAGSDSGFPWALVFYLAALLAVGWAVYRRLFRPKPPSRRDRKRAVAKDQSVRQDKTAMQ